MSVQDMTQSLTLCQCKTWHTV